MPLADFIHLRVHSAYSLSAGAIKIKELVQLCRSEAMPAVAITDTGNLFGALEFAMACAEPAVALAGLAAANDGLLCLAGGAAGPVGRLLAEGQAEAAEAALAALQDIFPGRLYIE